MSHEDPRGCGVQLVQRHELHLESPGGIKRGGRARVVLPDGADQADSAEEKVKGRKRLCVGPLQVIDEEEVWPDVALHRGSHARRIAALCAAERAADCAAKGEVGRPGQRGEGAAFDEASTGLRDRRPNEARLADAGLADDSNRSPVGDRCRQCGKRRLASGQEPRTAPHASHRGGRDCHPQARTALDDRREMAQLDDEVGRIRPAGWAGCIHRLSRNAAEARS